ncbi:MAG: hypothetical protein AAFO07_25615, partial [Bacteroidota bacterium]
MKEDPIKRLVKESGLTTSPDFADSTMERLAQRMQRKYQVKLYLLIALVAFISILGVVVLINSGFRVDVFGKTIGLPKVITMIGMSLVCYLSIMHL